MSAKPVSSKTVAGDRFALQPGDRVVHTGNGDQGIVKSVYLDGSASILWDGWEAVRTAGVHLAVQPELFRRVCSTAELADETAPSAQTERRKTYGRALCKTLLRYADGQEADDVVLELETLVRSLSERRPMPGLVAARYELFRKFWLSGDVQ